MQTFSTFTNGAAQFLHKYQDIGKGFRIFNIWLNKIHLCKQTQDKAITKPNKQENNHGLFYSQATGLG